jgi:hypothetical protein
MSGLRLPLLILFVLIGTPARAAFFVLEVGAYQSPDFENNRGTGSFHVDGTTHGMPRTISLRLGVPTFEQLDLSEGFEFHSPPRNNDPTPIFFGTSVSSITLDGVSGTVSDNYSYLVPFPFPNFPPVTPVFFGGPSTSLVLGDMAVQITPVANTMGGRAALFTLTAVPEPSSATLCGLALLSIGGFARVRARRAAPRSR